MSTKTKAIVIGVFVVLLGGAWAGMTLFGGNPPGGPCQTDSECNGMDGTCWVGEPSGAYCTLHCSADAECPSGWTCNDVTITNIDGSGNQSAGGATKLCARPAPGR